MHVTFQLKTRKADSTGKAPVYTRITIDGKRAEFSIKRYVDPAKWISNPGAMRGTTEETKSVNAFINTVRFKLNEHHRLLFEANKPISAEAIKNAYLGLTEHGRTLVEVFKFHNSQMKELIGKDFSKGTHERYCAALKHIQDFMKWKYNTPDIPLRAIKFEFVTEFEYYLKVVKRCSHNTAIKYITNLRKIIRIALNNEWLERDPFANFKIKLREVKRECLSKGELELVASKTFATERLEQVRDIFLFCCYTGLAYADVKKLSPDHIVLGMDRKHWIKIDRTKTDTRSSIRLLPAAKTLMEKYETHPVCQREHRLFPVLSIQKMNAYLKEIADLCGITKPVTFHLARHTFATTVTLTNGVPIESVSRMLGHKSIRTTQHYAKIVDQKLSEDMALLEEKLNADSHTKKSIKKVV